MQFQVHDIVMVRLPAADTPLVGAICGFTQGHALIAPAPGQGSGIHAISVSPELLSMVSRPGDEARLRESGRAIAEMVDGDSLARAAGLLAELGYVGAADDIRRIQAHLLILRHDLPV